MTEHDSAACCREPSRLAAVPAQGTGARKPDSRVKTGCAVTCCAVTLIAALPGCRPAAPAAYETIRGETMGTTYTIRIAQELSDPERYAWQQRIDQRLAALNSLMSTYRADSQVCRFNRSTSTDWYPVSPEVARVVAAADQVSRETEGAFDITVGPLVNLWSFGPDRRPAGLPAQRELDSARARVGYQRLHVRREPPALRKDDADLNIDLSAIAKGYAVDQVSELLERADIVNYMVEIGGEVRTRGRKSDGSAWRIGVERPNVGQRLVQTVLELGDHSLATSGDYRNVFEWEGELYSHEIDPLTGRPARHGVAAVSVLAAETMMADAYATALMVMPLDRAWELVERAQLEVMVVSREPAGFRQRTTRGFAERIVTELN
jgi:thiamine biosynthesis lipoprotein